MFKIKKSSVKKASVWTALMAVVCLFVSGAYSGPKVEWPQGGRPILNGEHPDKDFYEVDIPELFTTQLTRIQPDPKALGTMVLYAGIGARSATHGVTQSLFDIAKRAVKLNYNINAFDNPVYWNAREQITYMYETETMVNWMAHTARLALAVKTDAQKFVMGGRSAGAAILLEALHRYLKTNANADVFGKLDHVVLMGPVDHRPELYSVARKIEAEWLAANPGLLDQFAFEMEPRIFKNMGYANEPVGDRGVKSPVVTFIVGIHDPLTSTEKQIDVAYEFHRMHPHVPVRVIVSDTAHNPAKRVTYTGVTGEPVLVKDMKRMGPIMAELLDPKTTFIQKGFEVRYMSEVKQSKSCPELLLGRPLDSYKTF